MRPLLWLADAFVFAPSGFIPDHRARIAAYLQQAVVLQESTHGHLETNQPPLQGFVIAHVVLARHLLDCVLPPVGVNHKEEEVDEGEPLVLPHQRKHTPSLHSTPTAADTTPRLVTNRIFVMAGCCILLPEVLFKDKFALAARYGALVWDTDQPKMQLEQ